MRIAFYAPLKSPHHQVPSGDRLMARLLMAALVAAGHRVELVSELRSFSREPAGHAAIRGQAEAERVRIADLWTRHGQPDLWFTYHPYYKAPDFLGPPLSSLAGIPYVTAEASYAPRRNGQGWADQQAELLGGLRQAALNICMTERDRDGLAAADSDMRLALLPPFLDAQLFLATEPAPVPGRLAAVAMMRPGDKLESYRALAAALKTVRQPFTLDIIGGGPCRQEVEAIAAAAAPGRVRFLGELPRESVAEALSRAALYVWPGCGEAYGLAYLEAAAAGVPAIAYRTAGVPAVVADGESGLLVEDANPAALGAAIDRLLDNEPERRRLSAGARAMVKRERTVEAAATRLGRWLDEIMEKKQ